MDWVFADFDWVLVKCKHVMGNTILFLYFLDQKNNKIYSLILLRFVTHWLEKTIIQNSY